jgi:hypothetical protein
VREWFRDYQSVRVLGSVKVVATGRRASAEATPAAVRRPT